MADLRVALWAKAGRRREIDPIFRLRQTIAAYDLISHRWPAYHEQTIAWDMVRIAADMADVDLPPHELVVRSAPSIPAANQMISVRSPNP